MTDEPDAPAFEPDAETPAACAGVQSDDDVAIAAANPGDDDADDGAAADPVVQTDAGDTPGQGGDDPDPAPAGGATGD